MKIETRRSLHNAHRRNITEEWYSKQRETTQHIYRHIKSDCDYEEDELRTLLVDREGWRVDGGQRKVLVN